MGREVVCAVRIGELETRAKAHLGSSSLDLSGAMRLSLAFDEIRDAVGESGWLRLQTPRGVIALKLGKEAPAWARAIRSPKSRLEKLGVLAGMRVCALGAFEPEFKAELEARLGAPPATAARGRFDAIFRVLAVPRDLLALAKLREHLEPAGALWLIYRKGKGAPLGERAVREALLAAGLVDVKVVSFSDSHTALKTVIPRAQRTGS